MPTAISSRFSSRFSTFDILLGLLAAAAILVLSASLQRAGATQPLAMSAAVAAGLSILFPTMRRWSGGRLRFWQWAGTIALIVIISAALQLLMGHA